MVYIKNRLERPACFFSVSFLALLVDPYAVPDEIISFGAKISRASASQHGNWR
jgi:hypothetical protein